jgi:hypothetical protein
MVCNIDIDGGAPESIQSTGIGTGTGLVLILHRVKCWRSLIESLRR